MRPFKRMLFKSLMADTYTVYKAIFVALFCSMQSAEMLISFLIVETKRQPNVLKYAQK